MKGKYSESDALEELMAAEGAAQAAPEVEVEVESKKKPSPDDAMMQLQKIRGMLDELEMALG